MQALLVACRILVSGSEIPMSRVQIPPRPSFYFVLFVFYVIGCMGLDGLSMSVGNAIIAMLRRPKRSGWRVRLEEFRELVVAAGYNVVDVVVQVKRFPVSATLFGRGKVREFRVRAEENGADTLIVWNSLKSIQKFNLERFTGLRVIDRYELVLEIFQNHAGDKLAKLQIELAYLEKLIPYFKLREKLIHGPSDKPFFRAGGEYGWVPKIAWLRKRRKKLNEEINRLLRKKVEEIRKRKELGFRIVTFVGYYNAGKTSLFNLLTGEDKRVSPMPFTTLSPKYSRLRNADRILLVDTIGFVSGLDPRIISSFRLNLEDILEADLLVWVVDVSDSDELLDLKIRATANILRRNHVLDKARIVVANKMDLLDAPNTMVMSRLYTILQKYASVHNVVPCSAKTGEGSENIASKIIQELSK